MTLQDVNTSGVCFQKEHTWIYPDQCPRTWNFQLKHYGFCAELLTSWQPHVILEIRTMYKRYQRAADSTKEVFIYCALYVLFLLASAEYDLARYRIIES